MKKRDYILIAFAVLLLYFSLYYLFKMNDVQVPNPASEYCLEMGYQYKIINETGFCYNEFAECEEWKFINGDCDLEAESKNSCSVDSDCVSNSCCHPSGCVNKENAPDCSNMFCTLDCRAGTLDCGQGECKCLNGSCQAVFY